MTATPLPKPFVIISSQRTGSTLLARSLDAIPDIFCAGELFHRGPHIHHPECQYPYRLLGSRMLGNLRDSLKLGIGYRNHLTLFYRHAGSGSAAVGFKIMVSQIQRLPGIMAFFAEQDVTRFYLYREDTFAAALSYFKAKVSGTFHSDQTAPGTVQRSVKADEEQFRRIFETCGHDKSLVRDLHRNHGGHLLVYEDMAAGWDQLIDRIGRELGLSGLRVEKVLTRIAGHVGGTSISNESELRRKFSVPSPREARDSAGTDIAGD